VQLEALAPGLTRWAAAHPAWQPGHGWEREVAAYLVETATATLLLDPLVPARDEDAFWRWLDRELARLEKPVAVLLSRAGHFRSSQALHDRYGAIVYGNERARDRLDPVRDFRAVEPGSKLPGDVRALHTRAIYDETPLFFPSHGALAVGDLVVSVENELRVWWVAEDEAEEREYHEQHVPSLREWLELPIEHVLVSHGDYVPGGGAALAAAFDRPPWNVS
jgi:hypothetical protein